MGQSESTTAKDLGLLTLRLTVGGLMAGHGAQKLFGAFGGYGLEGTGGWLESLGMKPGKQWALAAGAGEFGSGMLMVLGLLNPVGPISMWGPMAMAWQLAHKGKPIWVTAGGAELPLTNMAVGAALALTGPGRLSLDHALGVKVSRPLLGALTAAGVAGGVLTALAIRREPEVPEEEAEAQLQSQSQSEEQQLEAGS